MALFGRSRRANTQPTIPLMAQLQAQNGVEPMKQGGTEQVRSQRGQVAPGLFGPFRAKSLPRTLQLIGAGLEDIGGGQNTEAFLADEERQRALDMALGAQARTQKREDQQTAAIDDAIRSLPPQQQAWARLNPEAFMRAYVESQMDNNNGWNVGQGYSHAFRVNPDGTLEQGAPLPLRPRAPNMGYVMPGDVEEWDYSNE